MGRQNDYNYYSIDDNSYRNRKIRWHLLHRIVFFLLIIQVEVICETIDE